LVLSPIVRRFIGHQPWMWVSIALAVVAVAAPAFGVSSRDIAGLVVLLLVFGLFVTYERFMTRTHRAVIAAFRNAFGTYQRLVGPTSDDNPMQLMNRLSSELVRGKEETPKAVWDMFADRTYVINGILTQLLQDCIDALNRLDPMDMETGESIKILGTRIWRTIEWYHADVIRPLLRMREERAPQANMLRENFSKFRMLYNDVFKDVRSACEKANSELGLTLRTDISNFLLPEPG